MSLCSGDASCEWKGPPPPPAVVEVICVIMTHSKLRI